MKYVLQICPLWFDFCPVVLLTLLPAYDLSKVEALDSALNNLILSGTGITKLTKPLLCT